MCTVSSIVLLLTLLGHNKFLFSPVLQLRDLALANTQIDPKKKLLSSSAGAIKTCVKYNTNDTSFERLHEIYQRATPEKYLLYKTALTLYKLYNSTDLSIEWAALNLNQILTSRQTHFLSLKPNLKRVGINALASRFYILNGKIDLSQFNKSLLSFKLQCKKDFLLT